MCGFLRVSGQTQHRWQGVAVCPGAWLCAGDVAVTRGRGCGQGAWLCRGHARVPRAWPCPEGGAVGRGLGLCWSRVTVPGASASEGQANFCPAVLECVGCHVCRIPPPAPLQLW